MNYSCNYLPYTDTGYFSSLVTDYLAQDNFLQNFIEWQAAKENIEQAISAKKANYKHRNTLTEYFAKAYANVQSAAQKSNIELLKNENCFTITTAHQPNIFTGPLYFIYKIIHAIKIANELNEQYSDYTFVPVYYMGSEDADIDELGNINIQHKKIKWQTEQTGAVGRMKVDKAFIALINEIEGQIAVNKYGSELINIFRECYVLNTSIQDCTFKLVNALFAKYGLLVVVPDSIELKQCFNEVVTKELTEQFSAKAAKETVTALQEKYDIKPTGRDINLFYLLEDKRERIELINGKYVVNNLQLSFTKDEILTELNQHPERFSANVILRPVFQETILPNIVFIGGGGEINYWLQLKKVFEQSNVAYPMLVLRNSFLIYSKTQQDKLAAMNLDIKDLFSNTDLLFTNWVKNNTTNNIDIANELNAVQVTYNNLKEKVEAIDITLQQHITALQVKAAKRLQDLQKKILRAEKRKFSDQKQQLENIKQDLFYNNNLQERTENFSYLYSLYGKELLDVLLQCSKSFEQEFCLISINK